MSRDIEERKSLSPTLFIESEISLILSTLNIREYGIFSCMLLYFL
jgi:hypothetical protein